MRACCLLFALLVACGDNATIPPRDRYEASDPAPLACFPNLDGRIDATEIQPALGVPVSFLVSPEGSERPVDIAGEESGGARLWDWSVDLEDDQAISVAPAPAGAQWYAASFPADAFVTPFDASARIDSIARHAPEGLFLLGLASHDEAPPEGQTLLVYQEPVLVLRFPIEPGMELVSTGTIEGGVFRGLPYAGSDIYEISADALGELRLPQIGFGQAQRVRSRVTVQPAVGAPSSTRQVSFYFECFAEVARAVSRPDEPDADFTVAAELRRLGLE